MIIPERLAPGDTIGIIATSDRADLSKGLILKGVTYLEDKGFSVVQAKNLRSSDQYTAGTAQERVDAIHQFVEDDTVKALINFWGGFNSNHILELLDFPTIQQHPKIIMGYSDFTTITLAISHMCDMVTYHGPAVITFTKPQIFSYTWEYFEKLCIDDHAKIQIKPSDEFSDDLSYIRDNTDSRMVKKNEGHLIYRHGETDGEILTANLSSLLTLASTPYFPEIKNKILWIEEGEYASAGHIDRGITQLKQMGIFKKIKGLVLGRFMSQSYMPYIHFSERLITSIDENLDYPIIYNLNFGHTDPIITIPNGGYCSIDTHKGEIFIGNTHF